MIGVLATVTSPDVAELVKEGSLGAGWTDEDGNAVGLDLASAPASGPLIAVVTEGFEAMVKEGSLTAPWNDEYSNVTQADVAG